MLQKKNWLLRGLIAAALAQGALAGGAAQADEYDNMRARWALRGGAVDNNDPDVIASKAQGQDNNQAYWDTMQRNADRTALWPDLADWSKSTNVTNSFMRLGALAGAYKGGNANLKNNADVLQAVYDGIDWMLQNYYNANTVEFDNWWDWQIGTPQQINNMVYAMYDIFPEARRTALLTAIDRFVPYASPRLKPDGTAGTAVETGANRLDKAFILVMRGMLGKNSDKLAAGRDAISQTLPYVTSGDGFYADGTFVQHTHEPYVGGYGGVLLSDISKLYYLLAGSTWDVTDVNKGNAFDWAMKSFRPMMFNGGMMDAQRGRQITRQFVSDHVAGRGIVSNMLALGQALPADQGAQINAVLKGWLQRDTSFGANYFAAVPTATAGVMGVMSGSDITSLKAILNDPNIVAADEPQETRVYPSGDRVLMRQPGYAFGLSMFSKRMSAFETGNQENRKGWWTGMGMTYLYNSDQTQYGGSYWATVNMLRLAGTTTDHSNAALTDWKFYGNTKTGVGGAELNKQYAAVGMDFAALNVTGTPLVGKKAWFLFGDKVVAVGSGITTTDGKSVETIVENRKLSDDGQEVLTVDNTVKDSMIPWQENMAGVNWAHLTGSAAGSDLGYVFPDAGTSVAGLREQRSGAWSDAGSNADITQYTGNYLSLALEHGVNPANASYTYIMLPNRTAEQVATFAGNTGITVLERSTSASAVKDSTQGVTGLVFWNDSSKTVNANGQPLVTSDKKSAVVLKQVGTDLQVAVADPTQLNTGNLNIEVNRAATAVVSADPGVTVVQSSPTIKLQIAVNGSAGKSYASHFTLSNLSTLAPAADAYVRDGTYASTNFGTATILTVKSDALSYSRKGMLKFDLSSVEGVITGASLRLTPTSVGMGGITHKLYQTVNANWDEGTVAWNNRPANDAEVASWVVGAVNNQVQVDVTNSAVNAMAGNKLLSFDIEAAQNYGSSGSVDYASRTHGTTAYRPVLVVTVQ